MLRGHEGAVTGVSCLPDGRRAASAAVDKTLKLWDLETGVEIATLTTDAPVHACAVIAHGRMIAAAEALGRVHFLRLEGM